MTYIKVEFLNYCVGLFRGVPLDYFVHEQPVYGVSADPVNESVFCSACDDGRILIFDIRESGNGNSCVAQVLIFCLQTLKA